LKKSIVYIFTLIVLILLTPNRLESFNGQYNIIISSLYLLVLLYFLRSQSKIYRNWARFDVIFLIGYTIVHFQIPFLASIGVEPSRPYYIWINKDVVNFATWMSAVAITMWMWGYTLYVNKRNKVSEIKLNKIVVNYRIYDILLLFSFILFLGTVGKALFTGVYKGTSNWGDGAVYAYLVLKNLLYLRIVYFFKNIRKNASIKEITTNLFKNKTFTIVAVIYVLLFLFQGDRGPVLGTALVSIGSYTLFVKPITFAKLSVFITVGAFIFTIIGFGRVNDASLYDEGHIFKRGMSYYNEKKDETNITNELASSIRIQYMALDIVPKKHPYLYGQMYLTGVFSVIPFAGSTIQKVFNMPIMYAGSSNFFTILEQGPKPSSGVGSEILADIYINFGLFGTFLIMFIFGMLTKKSFNNAMLNKFTYVIIYIGLISVSLSLNRNPLLTPLKDIIYMLFFNFLFTKIIK
jgi:hypothetical protein